MYIANQTRPDLSFVVNYLSRATKQPTSLHLKYARKVLIFMNYTRNQRIHLGLLDNHRCHHQPLIDYSDASNKDLTSQTGVMFIYYGSLIAWKSHIQATVSGSSTDAALYEATEDCIYLKESSEYF